MNNVKYLKYYLIDKELPELEFNSDNIGIDLYSRVDMVINPCIGYVRQRLLNTNILKPGQSQEMIVDLPGVVSSPTLIPMNVVLKGDHSCIYLQFPRSSLFKKKRLLLTNSVGIIDPSYEGIEDEVCASVVNLSAKPIEVKKGEKLTQLVLINRPQVCFEKAEEHWGTETRGGFGSTGGYTERKEISNIEGILFNNGESNEL
jgi:dUTP pyrophosphatase